MRQIFFDTETTGLDADKGDRVIEIGCVEMVNRQLTGNNLHLYINPERASHEDALRVHGLTEAFLADKPKFAQIVDQLLSYLAGAELVIHNAPFDIGFVNAELKRLRRGVLTDHVGGVRDTLLMARDLFPGKANSLDALCRRLEVDNTKRVLHGALLDAELLADVYIRLTRGQDALLMDDHGDAGNSDMQVTVEATDLSRFELPVLIASEAEVAAHAKLLADLDKASGGACQWRKLQPAPQAVA
ncbi:MULTISPECIES: DNA polymerase III subunit epsilon [unclassified Roseateles]|uniref:DNA polymerase III subunit epsilon n=1 Tax=unclassified Roseateles TaxID=2626991 RepID=UPI0006F43766|nr:MULTISPECIES: DNA polymerase III subunit epsilon [unclassified Roseateles]KQW43226.1 DNA polymerase III subunit epsilon [Pelomonas sp. Root405]KRA70964.1 DNA polymerase III subunit epsilon [Pelomonas sp. Root662]